MVSISAETNDLQGLQLIQPYGQNRWPKMLKIYVDHSLEQASVNPLQRIPEGCTQLVSLTHLSLNDCLLEYVLPSYNL